jgi:phosphoribosyl 1,2-cyclic phosphodiesterase
MEIILMKISILGSGSSGNSTLLITPNLKILIDCGFSYSYINKKLIDHGILPKEIDYILITHNHEDHIYGLKQFLKRNNTKVISGKKMNIDNSIVIEKNLEIEDLKIESFPLSHDSEEINGYILENNGVKAAYITDTGYINIKNHELLKNLNGYVIESNHDIEKLMQGPYPHHLKQRVISDKGHLSNRDAINYLNKFIGEKTKTIILFHISEKNNSEELVRKEFEKIKNKNVKLYISKQKETTELINID